MRRAPMKATVTCQDHRHQRAPMDGWDGLTVLSLITMGGLVRGSVVGILVPMTFAMHDLSLRRRASAYSDGST